MLRAVMAGRRFGSAGFGLLLLLLSLCAADSAEPGELRSNDRPYEVLKSQNLVLFISVLSILLLAMLIMAVCVYKPLRRR